MESNIKYCWLGSGTSLRNLRDSPEGHGAFFSSFDPGAARDDDNLDSDRENSNTGDVGPQVLHSRLVLEVESPETIVRQTRHGNTVEQTKDLCIPGLFWSRPGTWS